MDAGGIPTANIANGVWTSATRTLSVEPYGMVGSEVQAVALAAAINLATVATTNAVNYSGTRGLFVMAGFTISTTIVGAGTWQIEVVADGGTVLIFPITTTGQFSGAAKSLCSNTTGAGGTAADSINFFCPISFQNSLVVRLNVTTGCTSGNADLRVIFSHV